MDLNQLRDFFMWMSLINIGLMWCSLILLALIQDTAYRIHSKFFPMSQESFTLIVYAFLGLYKIVIIAFNVAPFLALLILTR